jgi:hypothetical protein
MFYPSDDFESSEELTSINLPSDPYDQYLYNSYVDKCWDKANHYYEKIWRRGHQHIIINLISIKCNDNIFIKDRINSSTTLPLRQHIVDLFQCGSFEFSDRMRGIISLTFDSNNIQNIRRVIYQLQRYYPEMNTHEPYPIWIHTFLKQKLLIPKVSAHTNIVDARDIYHYTLELNDWIYYYVSEMYNTQSPEKAILESIDERNVYDSYVDTDWDGATDLYQNTWCMDKTIVTTGAAIVRGYKELPSKERDVAFATELKEDLIQLVKIGGQDLDTMLTPPTAPIQTIKLTYRTKHSTSVQSLVTRITRRYNKYPCRQVWKALGQVFMDLLRISGTRKIVGSGGTATYEYTLDLNDWFLHHVRVKNTVVETGD